MAAAVSSPLRRRQARALNKAAEDRCVGIRHDDDAHHIRVFVIARFLAGVNDVFASAVISPISYEYIDRARRRRARRSSAPRVASNDDAHVKPSPLKLETASASDACSPPVFQRHFQRLPSAVLTSSHLIRRAQAAIGRATFRRRPSYRHELDPLPTTSRRLKRAFARSHALNSAASVPGTSPAL